jgi:hypothetical protein
MKINATLPDKGRDLRLEIGQPFKEGRREDFWWSEAAARKCWRGGRADIAIFSCPIHVNLIAPLHPGFRAMQKHADEGSRVALCRRVTGNGR